MAFHFLLLWWSKKLIGNEFTDFMAYIWDWEINCMMIWLWPSMMHDHALPTCHAYHTWSWLVGVDSFDFCALTRVNLCLIIYFTLLQ